MQLVNTFIEEQVSNKDYLGILVQILAPFAPHMAEELWVEVLGQPFSVHTSTWPKYDSKYLEVDQATIIVQINGKIRTQFTINNLQFSKEKIEKMAKENKNIKKYLEGKEIKKVIFVPGKLVNFVV